jgi:TonB family protein
LTYVVLFASLAQPVFGLTQTPRGSREVFYKPLEKRFPYEPNQSLTVIVNNVGAMGVVSVETASKLQGSKANGPHELKLRACTILYDDNEKAMIDWLRVKNVVPLSEEDVSFSNQTLTIDGNATPNSRVVVHVAVPDEVKLTLYVNGKLFRRGPFSRNMMIQNGEITANMAGYSFGLAVMQAIQGGPPPHPDVIQYPLTPGDAYRVPWDTLKSLATVTVAPAYSPTESLNVPPQKRGRAVVEVVVNEAGTVREASYAVGDEGLAQAAIQALQQWRFQPFVVNDKPVVIKCDVPVILQDGKVLFAAGTR